MTTLRSIIREITAGIIDGITIALEELTHPKHQRDDQQDD